MTDEQACNTEQQVELDDGKTVDVQLCEMVGPGWLAGYAAGYAAAMSELLPIESVSSALDQHLDEVLALPEFAEQVHETTHAIIDDLFARIAENPQ